LVSGLAGTSALGTVTVQTDFTFSVTGVVGTGAVGTVNAFTPDARVDVTGVVGTTGLGSVAATGITRVLVSGLSAQALLGTVTLPIWSPVDDAQGGAWTPVSDTQTPNWQTINDTQTPNWTVI